MFSGIVQSSGTLVANDRATGDARLGIRWSRALPDAPRIGDSIAVNGCCLTVSELMDDGFRADVSSETLACTTLGSLAVGDRINLEGALRAASALGGHLVSGHVDGLATLVARRTDERSLRLRLRAPLELARYIAPKGSVTIDGVSLTVNTVEGAYFDVNLIPHTLEVTTLGELAPGDAVNLEVDLIARYLERLLVARDTAE